MNIVDHRLTSLPYKAANRIGGVIQPTLLLAHDTANNGNTVRYFQSRNCVVGAHVVIPREGKPTQMAPFNRRTNHAGFSEWNGRHRCNGFAIGIEVENPGMMVRVGDEAHLIYDRNTENEKLIARFPIADCVEVNTKEHGHGWCLPYTKSQIDWFVKISVAIVEEYPDVNNIRGHFHVSPKRKVDVNPLFPFDEINERVFDASSEEDEPAPPPPVRKPVYKQKTTAVGVGTTVTGIGTVIGGGLIAVEKATGSAAKISENADRINLASINWLGVGVGMLGFAVIAAGVWFIVNRQVDGKQWGF